MNQDQLDLLIIGAGPAGLSAAAAAAVEDLNYLVIEKGVIASTIHRYPIGRTVFSTTDELEMEKGALKPIREKPTREELLSYYLHFALDRDLRINTDEEVIGIERSEPEGFVVRTTRASYHAKRVLFTIGAMDHPRRLNVPGEDLPKVHHRFAEPYPYVRKEVLVVGGGNSDADLTLLRQIGVKTEKGKVSEIPVYDPETYETNVPGIYVAGHFTNERHIKQAIDVPRRVVPLIAQSLRASAR